MHPIGGNNVVATATTTITTIVTTNANMVNATTTNFTTCNPYTSPSLDHHILKKSKELPKNFQRTSDDQFGRTTTTTTNEPKFSLQSSSSYHRRHSVSGTNN